MTVLETSFPTVSAPAQPAVPTLPLLQQTSRLLEYRGAADPDGEFIPKTICGFAGGAMLMFFCLDIGEALFAFKNGAGSSVILQDFWTRFAFMVGITGVACSLLLVGVKVRADHAAVQLYARHWLNSIGTGAGYAFLIWIPWIVSTQMNHMFPVNRFVAAAVWMALMSIPVFAAKWVIAPHPDHAFPAVAPVS